MGGMLVAGTKGVNGRVIVNSAVRGHGWCVVGWYQGCKRYSRCKLNGTGDKWYVVGWYQGCKRLNRCKQNGEG